MVAGRESTDGGTELDAWAASITTAARSARSDDDTASDRVLVVGGGHVGRRLARRLSPDWSVHHIDTDPTVVTEPKTHEATHVPDLTAPAALVGVAAAEDLAIVLTGEDGQNLLVAQQLRLRFGVEQVVVVLADPRNREAFDLPAVEAICAGSMLVDVVAASLDPKRDAVSP